VRFACCAVRHRPEHANAAWRGRAAPRLVRRRQALVASIGCIPELLRRSRQPARSRSGVGRVGYTQQTRAVDFMVLPLLPRQAFAGLRCPPNQAMEGHAEARTSTSAQLRARRCRLPQGPASGPCCAGLMTVAGFRREWRVLGEYRKHGARSDLQPRLASVPGSATL
jgi:hypothetical protein